MKPVFLKPRGAAQLVQWEEIAVDAPELGPQTPLDDAQFVAIDVETTGNAPFLVLELGAERFKLSGPLSFFDTLVDCRAPINPYAKKRHHIDRSMLIGAPEFLVQELGLDVTPAHAALDDARATAMVFRGLVARARVAYGWTTVGEILAVLPRPVVDRTTPSRKASAAGQAPGARGPTGPPRSGAPGATRRATSPTPTARRGRSSRRRRSGSSDSPGGSPA